jgi:hypothetical protein
MLLGASRTTTGYYSQLENRVPLICLYSHYHRLLDQSLADSVQKVLFFSTDAKVALPLHLLPQQLQRMSAPQELFSAVSSAAGSTPCKDGSRLYDTSLQALGIAMMAKAVGVDV